MNFKNFLKSAKPFQLALAAALAFVFILSMALYLIKTPGVRRAFRFQSVDSGRNNVEWRLLARRKRADKAALYVEELLLGPKTERSRPLFSPGTKAEFCFERGKTLYVGLSADLLEKSGNASEIMEGIELFKLNVRKAFPRYKQVEIYIDKKGLFEE